MHFFPLLLLIKPENGDFFPFFNSTFLLFQLAIQAFGQLTFSVSLVLNLDFTLFSAFINLTLTGLGLPPILLS